ncbi:MAG: hypothetical protein WCP65_04445 [Bacteroidota bacterium]
MLVEGMNVGEINTAIYRDYNIILDSSTLIRLENSYLDQRRKFKIQKDDSYPVFYSIKTKAKNNWILMVEKHLESKSVKTINDVRTAFFTYYHTRKGYRVFNPCAGTTLLVYNGHMFTRFRERMHLTISDPIDIIKHFFATNFSPVKQRMDKDGQGNVLFMSIEKDGYLMGNVQEYSDKIIWYVHKTFISGSIASFRQITYTNKLKLNAAKDLLKFRIGDIKELSDLTNEYCNLFGFMDKEVTIDFLKHLIEDMEKQSSK